ncbi:TRAP transporter, 4TM/12TM fusion protein [uncultured delta proteobacterium]|uniref:TRAP transporter, 4TM/12TM fusion protein n=1 Tax=uncultured delta proteobacterium TaxID=34034 RepID=A0A212JN67_9DELT|nr:TRAP transporter, 4TM/12TM fusion protein [uncultured delta proteobacterium]
MADTMHEDMKKNRTEMEQEVSDDAIAKAMGGELTEAQQKLIEELDKESSVRKLANSSLARAFYLVCIAVTLYHFITSFIGTPVILKHRSLHVAMMLALTFILYPFSKKSSFKTVAWYDWVLVLLSLAAPLYIWSDYMGVVERAGMPDSMDVVMATLLVVLVLEASRRVSGWALVVLSLVFIAYGLFGRDMPGIFGHRGYNWVQISNHFFANTEGIYGTSVSVAASYIFLFILFGTVMGKSGMGAFFNDFAMALAGHTKGGPAKVAVLSSGLLGSINGSAVANVVTTGAFTIPLMKKTGYSKEFAGAVEASASVGGQLLPPVMGAAAFIMAEILSVPYSVIIVHAAIPALLYYLGIIIQVQLRAGKTGLYGLPKDRLPKVKAVMQDKGHLLIPIFLLLYLLLFSGVTVVFAAVITIVTTIIVSMCKKSTRMSFKDICDAFADGAKQTVPVAIACACVGIIIGVTSKTGFGLTMANAIITLGSQTLIFTLVFTMITCMILGMGVPSIPAYIITATIAAPALAKLGIPAVAAHLFAFYYAMFANLTPPVALAAFAAAGISGGDAMKTGVAAVKLAIAGFIVPFMFVYSPQLLLINTTFLEGLRVTIGACIGVFMIGVAVEGYLFTKVNILVRIIAFGCAVCLIDGGLITDGIGLTGLVLLFAVQTFLARRLPPQAPAREEQAA